MRLHLVNLVTDVLNQYGSKPSGNWLDIGCNDGYTVSIAKSIGWDLQELIHQMLLENIILHCLIMDNL